MTRVIVLIIAMLIPTAVFAKSECSADVEKFCKDIDGREQIQACLDQHENELSSACKSRQEANKNCVGDVEKFCKDMKRKQRDACLDQHKDELSPGCKTSREAL